MIRFTQTTLLRPCTSQIPSILTSLSNSTPSPSLTSSVCTPSISISKSSSSRAYHTYRSSSRRSYSSSSNDLNDVDISRYADQETTGVTLRQMYQLGLHPTAKNLLAAAQFLYKETPIRLAKRLRDLEDLPFGLSGTSEVESLMAIFRESLKEATKCKYPTNQQEELEFTEMAKRILKRHQQVVVSMATGSRESFLSKLSRAQRNHFLLQEFLDRFNMNRIGLRMLLAQHVALHHPLPGFVGVIETACRPLEVVKLAIADAEKLCLSFYGVCPKVLLHEVHPIFFRYVPAHLRYMVFELLRNAMKSSVEYSRKKAENKLKAENPSLTHPEVDLTTLELPPIKIVIADGDQDVIIKVSDRGSGIKRSELPLIFTYTYAAANAMQQQAEYAAKQSAATSTTVNNPKATPSSSSPSTTATTTSPSSSATSRPSSFTVESPPTIKTSSTSPLATTPTSSYPQPSLDDANLNAGLFPTSWDWLTGDNFQPVLNAGLGDTFGMPLTRLYARYFGGDLQVYSMLHHGTDAILYLNKLGDANEAIME